LDERLAALADAVLDHAAVQVLLITLRVALCATLLAGPAGIAIGFLLARRSFPGKSVVETFVALPLVLPPTAIGYGLLSLFARSGPLGSRTLHFDLDVLFTWRAAVIASAVVALPLVARTARSAFEAVDTRLELMARSLGMSRARAFAVVTVPLARNGLLAATALGFGRALGEFGATAIIAGNIPGRTQTLSLAIFSAIQDDDGARALSYTAITVVVAFGLLWWIEHLLRRPASADRTA
jgi:molybdate transport system permease protein